MTTLLVVDDNKTNLQMVRSILGDRYNLLLALSGEVAVRYAQKKTVDLILLDLFMPDMDGRETLRALRQIPTCANVPVVFLTADVKQSTEVECLRLGASDFIVKPFVAEVLLTRIERILELEDYRKDLQGRLREKTAALEDVILQSITTIANTLDAKDEYTKGHSERVADYAVALAVKRNWTPEECATLHKIALLHDVGKIGLPDAVLKKESPLNEDEFAQVKAHTLMGANILKDITTLKSIGIGAMSHHERYDGNGYPQGLKGKEIPEVARIICIADAYDAMTSDRCYRHRMSLKHVRQELMDGAGTQFDPELVADFVALLEEGKIPMEFDFEEEIVA